MTSYYLLVTDLVAATSRYFLGLTSYYLGVTTSPVIMTSDSWIVTSDVPSSHAVECLQGPQGLLACILQFFKGTTGNFGACAS